IPGWEPWPHGDESVIPFLRVQCTCRCHFSTTHSPALFGLTFAPVFVAASPQSQCSEMTLVHQPRFRTCAISTRLVLLLAVVLMPCKANFCSDRSSLDMCYQSIEPLLDNDQLTGLPTTKQDLELMCEAFQSGMKCIDEFAKHCMKPSDQNYLQMTVAGARQMMKHLCDDIQYQNEYLKHVTCYSQLSEEWDLCTLQMKRVVEEYRNKKHQVTEEDVMKNSCCAKYEFLVCTEDVSFKKCSKEAA
uniref:Uncharacterized protein n=1 Tax=Strigamia maritima TaxID=126957 RepID=T1IHT2_STRMM